MGIRGELFSTKVSLQNRTYFFNVKENRMGDLYLNIVESKNKETGGFERQSIVLFAEDLQEFLKGFDGSLKVLEKAYREKKRSEFEKREPVEPREQKKGYVKKSTPKNSASKKPVVRAVKAVKRNPKES
jgi:flagellar basal body rod protein FlgC